MKVSFQELLTSFPADEYVELKQKAYDLYAKRGDLSEKEIVHVVQKELGYALDSVEGILVSSTLLYPFDAKICDDYYASGRNETELKKRYQPIASKLLSNKVAEIEFQKLDLLLGQGILNSPTFTMDQANLIRK